MNTPLTRIAPGTQTKSLPEAPKRFQLYLKRMRTRGAEARYQERVLRQGPLLNAAELEGRIEDLWTLKRALSVRPVQLRGSIIHSPLKGNFDKGLSGFRDNHLGAEHSTLRSQYRDAG